MFKKAITFVLSIALVICVAVPAFAATTDTVLTYDLSANGSNSITVNTNDVITVVYTITASARSATSTTQNQIIYDHNFFELVPGSIAAEPDYSSVFAMSNPVDSDGTHYIYYNSVSTVAFIAETATKIGTFQLKVKANAGSSVIQNTQFFATDKGANLFAANSHDLTVTVNGNGNTVFVTGVTVDTNSVSMKTGETNKLTASISPSDATNKDITWFSSNNAIASVDESGVVTAKSEGTAIITAKTVDGGKTATCTVTVVKEDLPIDDEIPAETEQPTEIPDEPDEPVTSDTPSSNPFLDVKAGEYYYDAVLWAAENEITQGTGVKTFSPDMPVIRAQVVTFLWRAAGCPEPTGDASKFDDVEVGSYYEKAVAWAIEQGITKGTSETTFSPDKICTRGQIVTFLARFAGVEDATTQSVFDDVKPDDYFAAAVKWAKDNGVTEGTSATTFSPNDDCTRGQIVTFLYRWMVR